MAIGPIVTRGYGSFGTVNLVVTRGYGASATPPTPPADTGGTGGALWAKGRGALKLRRPLTYSENEELRERLQAIAAQAVASIPMDRISDTDGHVIGDDPFDDDDLILQAALIRILH